MLLLQVNMKLKWDLQFSHSGLQYIWCSRPDIFIMIKKKYNTPTEDAPTDTTQNWNVFRHQSCIQLQRRHSLSLENMLKYCLTWSVNDSHVLRLWYWYVVFLLKFRQEYLDTLYRYAKFQYECGNYSGAAEYLYFFRVLVSFQIFITLNSMSFSINSDFCW